MQPKLVFVDTVAEMHRLLNEGKAELGFTALSMLNPSKKIEGSPWVIPKNYYPTLEQQAILLKHGENNQAAKDFLAFLKSQQVRNVIETCGYSLPK